MIDDRGGVIAADDLHLVRFQPDGTVKWKTPTPGGIPISPVIVENMVVILATNDGPLAAFDTGTGKLIGKRYLVDTVGAEEFYDTENTPGVSGNRIYVSTEKRNDPDHTARLWAVDVVPGSPDGVIQPKWSFEFGGPSGASPLIVGDTIYFDGDRLNPGEDENPHLFALQDNGDTCSLKWTHPMETPVKASCSRDPRGGVWAFAPRRQYLYRFDSEDGEMIDRLDIDAMVDEPGVDIPASVMTIAGDPTQPVMIISTIGTLEGQPARIMAIDLSTETKLWKINISEDWSIEYTSSQFAFVEDDAGRPVVIFPTSSSGAYGVGAP